MAKRGNEEQRGGPSSQKATGPYNKHNQNVSNPDVNLEVHKEQVNVAGLDATPYELVPQENRKQQWRVRKGSGSGC